MQCEGFVPTHTSLADENESASLASTSFFILIRNQVEAAKAGSVKLDVAKAHSLFYLPCLRKVPFTPAQNATGYVLAGYPGVT